MRDNIKGYVGGWSNSCLLKGGVLSLQLDEIDPLYEMQGLGLVLKVRI